MSEPIHAVEKDKVVRLIGKPVLYASDKEGLGTYGTLIGWNKRGYFIVEPDHMKNRYVHCSWIVEYR